MYLISDLAKQTGLFSDTIRFYEKKGLIQADYCADNQYRYYSQQTLKRLLIIRRCRALEMNLKEIAQLIQLEQHPELDCSAINDLLDQHLQHISQRIAELTAFQQQLTTLRNRCQTNTTINHCAILRTFEDESTDQKIRAQYP